MIKKNLNALNTKTSTVNFCVLCTNDDHRVDDCPCKRNYPSYTVIMAKKAKIKDELYYQNAMYNLSALNVIIPGSGCTRLMFAHKCYFANLRTVTKIIKRVAGCREVIA